MDEITEDSLPTKCIILSPEELVKLGVKLEKHVLATRPVSNIKVGQKEKVEEHIDVSTSIVAKNIQHKNFKTSPENLIDTGVVDKKTNIKEDNRTIKISYEGTESNASNIIEPFNDAKGTSEKRKTPFADDSLPSSNVNLGTPIQKRQKGRPKKIISPLTNKSLVDDIRDIKLSRDHDSEVKIKNNLESLEGDISKNDDVETSIRLNQIVSNNDHSSSEKNVGKPFHQINDSDSGKFQDKPQPSSSEVQKRGRGRPRKSIPNTMTSQDCLLNVQQGHDVKNRCDVVLDKQNKARVSSDRCFNEYSDITEDNSKKIRKSRIKKYVLNSDTDSYSDVNYDHDSDTRDESKNVKIETAKCLDQIVSTNGHSNSENNVDTKFPQLDDSTDKFQDETQPSSSKVDKKPEAQKRKRGRPRKSVSSMTTNLDDLLKVQLGNDAANIPSDENSDIIEGNSKKVRKSRIKKYNVLNSDTDSSDDLNTFGNIRGKKGAFKNRKIIDSDSNLDSASSREESISDQTRNKIEAGDVNSKSKDESQNISNVSSAVGDETSTICEENKAPRKRGRPKKNSLEASKTAVSCTPTIQQNITDDSLLIISKRGRKRKEVNYSFLENPDFPVYEINNHTRPLSEKSTVPRKVGRPKKNFLAEGVERKDVEYKQSRDIKIDDDGIQYTSSEIVNEGEDAELSLSNREGEVHENSTEGNKDSAKSSSRYNWTGNVTKAITRMFHVIRDNSVTDLSQDPVPGKNKRTGRSKESVDNADGFSVCMVCNETIPNPQWLKHKRKVHYNLAWRKGDLSLDLNNDTVVLKTLQQLVRERGFIKCNQCRTKIKHSKSFKSHLEMCSGVVNSSGFVTCAVCKTSMEKVAWHHHCYRQHNNLAWREGDPPLNLEDQEFVLRILNALYKSKKPFHCEKCDLQKKSVLGYLSHKSTCQKTAEELENLKVRCEKCGKKVLPVSMDYHIKSHDEKESKLSLVNSSSYFDVNVDISGKRKAAREALQVINSIKGQTMEEVKYYSTSCDFQESFVGDILSKVLLQHSPLKCIFVNCDFTADVVDNMTHHMSSCEKKPEQYVVCKICLFWCEAEPEIYEHIRAEHNKSFKGEQDVVFQSEEEQNDSAEDELAEDEDREKKRLRLMGKQKILNQLNAKVKPLFLMHPLRDRQNSLLYRPAYGWMWNFCESNYKFNLYNYVRNDRPWQILDCDILSDYLPKNSQSCDIASKLITAKDSPNDINELNYRKLGLFEISSLYDGDITIFCGGPISALAWLPTLYSEKTYNQVLAVAVFNSMESYYVIEKNYQEPSVIQFWDFGILDYKNNCSQPYLLFGMAVPYGPIWHLEWCPSGCLDCFEDDTTCRLGLLAVAASDSNVYIYSIDNLPDVNNRGLIYKGEPVLKLQLEFDKIPVEGQGYYPTKISWSKADSHRYVAVGYSTGLVAVYDLLNESQLLKRGNNTGTNIVFPYKSFQAHYSSITALTLHHLSGGNRFLFSASFDRTSIFWDLSTMTKITSSKKQTISDGVWITQWPTYLVTEDESTFNDKINAHSHYKTLRHFMSPDARNFTFSCSGIKTLSFSDWLNTILHGSNAGEVMAQFTHRMFCSIDTKKFKSSYSKSIFSLTKLVQKDISVQEVARTYDQAAKKYKVVFLDYSLNNLDDTPNSTARKKLTADNLFKWDVSEYGLQGINKVAFNPNPQACTYYAVGYQAGFIRLRWLQFLCPLLG